ncbi:ankyrin repeat domain-containing protein, partial [Salmonella sp. s51228]|uniref:ankyrin repeat domain-containing protein n=1 Tax=Salmonella sp. s51228 TaxID=3159652 RepID=UPI0039816F19
EYLKAKFEALNINEEALCKLKAAPSLQMLEEMTKASESEGREFTERRFENNATLLHIAAANGYSDCADFLISLGADTDAVDNDGWTPLHTAVHWEQENIIVKLVNANANINIGTVHGEYVLDLAPTREVRERIENLLTKHDKNTQAALSVPNSLRSRELRTSSMARTLSLNKESASLPKDILDKS